MSARLRLTALFGLVLLAVGTAIVVSVVLAMRFVPDYRITALPGPTASTTAHASAVPVDPSVTASSPPIALRRDAPPGAAGITISGERDLLRVLLSVSGVVLVVAAVAGVAISWVVAGRVLRPVAALTDAARRAEHGRGFRVPVRGPEDEFHRLATTLNAMLERLDRAFRVQQRFAANASHELRTPLAATQAMLDVAIADPSSVDLPALAARLRTMNARSVDTVDALLTLADAQSGPRVRDPVSLTSAVGTALAAVSDEVATEALDVRTEIGYDTCRGDPVLVDVLVTNLVRNAVRHNVQGGFVRVLVERAEDGGVALEVENSGAVVPEEQVARLIEPFSRAAGRVSGPRGHGLGLAIVVAIAEAHEARLDIRPRDGGGLIVRVVFPPDETMGP